MDRTGPVLIISLAAAITIVTAVLFTLRFGETCWGAIVRAFRHEEDHPHWEWLAQ